METERTLINLRDYCFYCLKKLTIDGDGSYYKSPACTPVPPSPLSTPLRTRCHNVHNLPPEERLAPFTDLCRYLGVELPDCYAFGDGSDPEVLYPPLCEKCHELSARLCVLQDELQYIQTRIHNTVDRIHRRVASTCDTRGAWKREEFNKDLRRQSKGSLSRGRGDNLETKKVTDLLKTFQVKIIEKDHETRERKKRRATNIMFPYGRRSVAADNMQLTIVQNDDDDNKIDDDVKNVENGENVQSESEDEPLSLAAHEYLPPEETLRSCRPQHGNDNHGQDFNVGNVKARRENEMSKPYPDVSTIYCSYRSNHDSHDHPSNRTELTEPGNDDYHLKTTLVIGVTTRSQSRIQQNTLDQDQQKPRDGNFVIRRRKRRMVNKTLNFRKKPFE